MAQTELTPAAIARLRASGIVFDRVWNNLDVYLCPAGHEHYIHRTSVILRTGKCGRCFGDNISDKNRKYTGLIKLAEFYGMRTLTKKYLGWEAPHLFMCKGSAELPALEHYVELSPADICAGRRCPTCSDT